MDYLIRSACEDDAESMIELLNAIIRDGRFTAMDQIISFQEQRAFIRTFPERGVFNVAVLNNGKIIGLQDVLPFPSERDEQHPAGAISTFVEGDRHRMGIGRSLCEATFAMVKEKGFGKIIATIRADNPAAIAFYTRFGFHRVAAGERAAVVLEKVV